MILPKRRFEKELGGQAGEEVEHDVALAAKTNKKKKGLSHIKCYHCGQMGHYSLKCLEKNIVKEKNERDVEAYAAVEYYAMKFE